MATKEERQNRDVNALLLYWGRTGGGARYTYEITRAMASINGHLLTSFSRQNDQACRLEKIDIDTHWVNTYASRGGFIIGTCLVPFKLYGLWRFMRKNRVGLVYCTMKQMWTPMVMILCRLSGIGFVLTCHDAQAHPGDGGKWRSAVMKWELNNADAIIVLTRHVRQQLASILVKDKPIFVIPHGLFDFDAATPFAEQPQRVPRKLLFFGRILEYKGLGLLLEAFLELKKTYPDLQLEIAGEGDLEPYRKYLGKLDGIVLKNRWIAEQEIPVIFQSNDILVTPYLEASQSGPIATALAFGMPVATTPVGGLVEQVIDGETGTVAEAVTSDSLALALRRLLDSQDFYRACRENSRIFAREKLSWTAIAHDINAALETVARRNS